MNQKNVTILQMKIKLTSEDLLLIVFSLLMSHFVNI